MIEENKTTFEQDVLVAHPGTHHSYMTATAVQELGRLNRYVTSFYLKRGNWWGRTLRSIGPIRRGAARRFSPFLDETKVRCIPQYELVEKLIDRSVCRKGPIISVCFGAIAHLIAVLPDGTRMSRLKLQLGTQTRVAAF